MSGLWCDIHIFFPRFPTSGEKNRCNRSLSSAPLLTHGLPRGEKGPLAVEGLCEGVAKCDHTSLAARAAALHYHAGHLHQLDGALPVLQRLGQVQHLVTNRVY